MMAQLHKGIAYLAGCILACLMAGQAVAAIDYQKDGWQLKREYKRDDAQIKVYLREKEDSNIKSFLGVSEVDLDIPTLLAVFNDVDAMTDWVYKMKSVEVAERKSPLEMVQYVVYSTPPPAKDRDLYINTKVVRNSKTGVVEIRSKMLPTYGAEKPGMVRIPEGFNTFRLTPLSKNRTRIEFHCHVDPGGFIPAWAVNMVLHTTPYYTMKRLFKQAKEPKYADAENQLKALWEGTYGAGSWEKDYPNGIWDPSYLEAQKATGIN